MEHLTPHKRAMILQRDEILRKGEPPIVSKGSNAAWITWYRALKQVTTNVAKVQLKRRLELSNCT